MDTPTQLLAYAGDLDATERPSPGEFDVASAIRLVVTHNQKMRDVLQAAKDDLERVAVEGDDFAETIAKIDEALVSAQEKRT